MLQILSVNQTFEPIYIMMKVPESISIIKLSHNYTAKIQNSIVGIVESRNKYRVLQYIFIKVHLFS